MEEHKEQPQTTEPPFYDADFLLVASRSHFGWITKTLKIAVFVIWHLSKKVDKLEKRVAQLEAALERADLDKRTLKDP